MDETDGGTGLQPIREAKRVSEARGAQRDESSAPAAEPVHPTWRFSRYLSAYRGNLTRSEASRRSGLPEVLWERVERSEPSEPSTDLLPAAIVATMCVSVGADVATGLKLAGHRPDLYPHLTERPPVFAPLSSTQGARGPCIATPHVVAEVLAVDSREAHGRMSLVYRHLAHANWQMANRLIENPPDERTDYWSGYSAAIRAVAEQQARAADQEDVHAAPATGHR